MGLNDTVSAERVHIGFFGMRNAGKSSLVNAVTGQDLAVVSDVKGTTTDPVKKAMELLPLGPVVIIDTPGLDDEGDLGELRIKKAKQVIGITDIAILCIDSALGAQQADKELIEVFEGKKIPYIIAYTKADIIKKENLATNEICVSSKTGFNIFELKEMMAGMLKAGAENKKIVSDLILTGDKIVLVVPIDSAAPKGRLILPQQQTIRDILDVGATAVVCRDSELEGALTALSERPKLVITDSQVFGEVSKIVDEDIMLTSFSILFARYKGDLKSLVNGAQALDKLRNGDKILISEGCTHHRQCGDIGTVKLPAWIKEYTGKSLEFDFTSGGEFPEELSGYALVVHCGGCMLNERQMKSRMSDAKTQGVRMTNYGIAIAHMNGILKRSIEPFPEFRK